jgi:hypothetical protein
MKRRRMTIVFYREIVRAELARAPHFPPIGRSELLAHPLPIHSTSMPANRRSRLESAAE